MKRNKAMKKQNKKDKTSTYRRKREFLVALNNRRVDAGLEGVFGFHFALDEKPWK